VVQVVRGIAAAHGLTVETEFLMSYPVTINDTAETGFAEATIGSLFGADRFVPLPHPLTASEDFSLVLAEVPGAFVFLGACPADRDVSTAPFNHAAEAAFDDGVLTDGAALLAALAQGRLTGDPDGR
jgi:hippurate hydrolase